MSTDSTTHIEISLDNLIFNVKQIKNCIPEDRKMIAVVKDNAYGCGANAIAAALEESRSVEIFAVARYEEAVTLRNAGITLPILILGKTAEKFISTNKYANLIYTLNDIEDCLCWTKLSSKIHFHINIDTGMTRMGILPSEVSKVVPILKNSNNCICDGIFTHFACADEPGTSSVSTQLILFNHVIEQFRSGNIPIPVIHFSNSAGALRFGLESCTHIRPGIALYGSKPDPSQDFKVQLKSVLSLKSFIVKMKKVPAHTAVSYGAHYHTASETWIAVIPAGYAHGVPRYLSNKGNVLIGGIRYPIVGNVTMDYIMVDVSSNPLVNVGDPVIIIGNQGSEMITPDHVALLGNTIGYEVLCNLGKSINRLYTRTGNVIMSSPGTIF